MAQQTEYSNKLHIMYNNYLNQSPDNLANDEMFKTEDGRYKYFTKDQFVNSIKTNSRFLEKWSNITKQTAVEWLGYELNTKLFYNISSELWEEVNKIFKQAKEIEREQLKEIYLRGIENYDPTFKRKSNDTQTY